MTITQTVDIPDDHQLMVDVPLEIPAGRTTLAFTPVETSSLQETPAPTETERKVTRVFGCAKGQFKMADDFDAPLEDFKDYM